MERGYRIRWKTEQIYFPDYLQHYGIKGQKWGVRRFQNADGTLTKEGYERYSEQWVKSYANSGKYREQAGAYIRQKGPVSKAKAVGYVLKSSMEDRKRNKIKKIEDKSVKKAAENFRKESNSFEEAKKKIKEFGGAGAERIRVELGIAEAKKDIEKLNQLKGEEKVAYHNKFLKELADDRKLADDEMMVRDKAYREGKPMPTFDHDTADEARMDERASWLQNQIETKSGDWYNSKPVTDGNKQISEQIKENRRRLKTREEQLRKKYVPDKDWSLSDFAKLHEAMQKDTGYLSCKKLEKQLDDELMGQILRDIGFPDTSENRKYIVPYVFWD